MSAESYVTVFEFIEDANILPQIIGNILGNHCWSSFNSWNVAEVSQDKNFWRQTHLPHKDAYRITF